MPLRPQPMSAHAGLFCHQAQLCHATGGGGCVIANHLAVSAYGQPAGPLTGRAVQKASERVGCSLSLGGAWFWRVIIFSPRASANADCASRRSMDWRWPSSAPKPVCHPYLFRRLLVSLCLPFYPPCLAQTGRPISRRAWQPASSRHWLRYARPQSSRHQSSLSERANYPHPTPYQRHK